MVDLPSNTTTTATFSGDVQMAASFSGDFEQLGDSDWIGLHLVAGTTYRFFARDETTPGVSGDAYLRFFDAHGVELAHDDNSGSGQNAYISFTATHTGTYFVGVNDVGNATGRYTVDLISSNYHGTVIINDEVVDQGTNDWQRFTSGTPSDDFIDNEDFDAEVEDTIFGGAGDDTIIAGQNYVDPKLDYSDANNTVYGGTGSDHIYGAYRDDTLHGDDGNDHVSGGAGNDLVWGDAGNDTIEGNQGADSLSGGTGADKMIGGDGSDTYYVDNARDVIDETNTNGLDKVYASVSFNLSDSFHCKGKVENLILTNIYDINGTGNAVANQIFGNGGINTLKGLAGNDNLDGRGGNDALIGGAGADQLRGGAGADRFIFNAVSESTVSALGRDTILDFSSAQHDKIDLHGIDANTVASGNQAFHFIGSGTFTHHTGELRYETHDGNVYLYGDINGDGSADLSVQVSHLATIHASDFDL